MEQPPVNVKMSVGETCDGVIAISIDFHNYELVQWTTRITETGITNLTRITNEMAASSNYLIDTVND